MNKAIADYKSGIQQRLGADISVNLFWKGRVALYAILKAIGIKEGDEVILPAFTCVVVPNVIIYLGAKPVYVDIDEKTYNIDISKIERKITDRTRVILAQNTFGLSSDIDEIIKIAEKKNLFVVEDCAHGFGGKYKNKPNGTNAYAAFFSSQWSKPFSTGLGGIAVTSDKALAKKIDALEEEAARPSAVEVGMLSVLLFINKWLLSPSTYTYLVKLYRQLSKMNLVVGSSQGGELQSPVLPVGFVKKMSALQARQGLWQLNNLNNNLTHRRKMADEYYKLLRNLNSPVAFEPAYATHTFLRYSILVNNKKEFLEAAEKRNLEVGDWFVSPIHPVVLHPEKWQYEKGSCPVAERICAHIINLPTHDGVNNSYLKKIEVLLKKHATPKNN